MSWWERGVAPGLVSLRGLFDDVRPPSMGDTAAAFSLEQVLTQLVTPGFPAMTSLAPVAPNIKPATVARYVEILQRLFVVEVQPAWAPALRSRARLQTAEKYHLADPALAAAALAATPTNLMGDLGTSGLLFESAVVHDLAVLSTPLHGRVRHFRDSNGHEIDAIITLDDGRWAAVEVELSGRQLIAGSRSLGRALDQIDTSALGEPAFRAVIIGTGPVLGLEDGTLTFPLAALMP